jgi:hypothetical protein
MPTNHIYHYGGAFGAALPQSSELRWGQRELFKLIESRWAHDLVNEGKIRLTTIGHSRNDYEAGKGRADANENVVYLGHSMARTRFIQAGTESEHAKQGYYLHPTVQPEDLGTRFVVKSGTFIEYDPRDDLYVYCVSHYQSRRLEIRFASGEDSWVEIFDPDGFFGAIDAEMTTRGHTPKGFKLVKYRSRFFPSGYTAPTDGELIKDPAFSSEHEVRACWIPAAVARPIDKLPLEIPELTKYCRIQRKVMPSQFKKLRRPIPPSIFG